jgi:dTDP-4-dehydrorhamnose reductase
MNILIVGKGWIGKKMALALSDLGHTVTICSHQYFSPQLKGMTGLIRYDTVVNCAGFTGKPNVDACEKDRAGTIQANSIFPIELHKQVSNYGARLVHFSSGCIYEGKIDKVDAPPNYFGSVYSVSKGVSDVYMSKQADVLNLRIRMPFSGDNDPKNLLVKLTNYASSGKLIEGGPNSITYVEEAIVVACEYIESGMVGNYNLVNEGTVTTAEIAEMLGLKWAEWYTPEQFAQVTAAKRSNCVIPNNSAMSDVKEALKKAILKLKGELYV